MRWNFFVHLFLTPFVTNSIKIDFISIDLTYFVITMDSPPEGNYWRYNKEYFSSCLLVFSCHIAQCKSVLPFQGLLMIVLDFVLFFIYIC